MKLAVKKMDEYFGLESKLFSTILLQQFIAEAT
jgi:hypothetical protein